MPADLHVHTTASDGTEPPERVVFLAARLGLDALAITDHDTIGGVAAAREAARPLGLEVVPGIEISTDYREREVHVLGYYVDITDERFLNRIGGLARGRARRVAQMVAQLRSLGLGITLDEVLREVGTASPGRPHVAAALVRLGIVGDRREAFERLIGRGCPGYVPREKFSPVQAVHLIRRAGGVPVLAHPGTAGADHLIPELVEAGLAGLEVYHPEHDAAQVGHYRALAAAWRLLATGGSDFHGYAPYARLGAAVAPTAVVQTLKRLAGGSL